MASNAITILIQAKDQASPAVGRVNSAIGGLTKQSEESSSRVSRLNRNFLAFAGLAAGAGIATGRFTGEVRSSLDAANKYQNALAGLSTIARHFKVDQDEATGAAKSLAADGLMTVTESATGLKNLLASGFSLPQAIKLMERFKDSAAFNRQASLGFGEAIAGATEGIKNGNSILVDNAGVTKNLSVILTEAGYSAQDLQKATTDVNVRQALYNGLLKETNPMVGDAAKLSKQFAGEQAKLSAETTKTQQAIGTALQPALSNLMSTVRPIVSNIGSWVNQNPQLASTLILVTGGAIGLLVTIGLLGTAVSTLSTAFTVLRIGSVLSATLTAAAWVGTKISFAATWLAMKTTALLSNSSIASSASRSAASSQASWTGSINTVSGKTGAMRGLMTKKIAMAVPAIGGAVAAIETYAAVVDAARQKVEALYDQTDKLNNDETKTSIAMIKNARKLYDQGKISSSELHRRLKIAANASGTPHSAGGLTLVGERGPELVNLPAGSRVSQNWKTREMASQGSIGGGGSTINVEQHIHNEIDWRTALSDISWRLRTA